MAQARPSKPTSQATPPGVVVEVFGLSCAGKSTLIANLSLALRDRVPQVVLVDLESDDSTPRRLADIIGGFTNLRFLRWALVNPRRSLTRRALGFARVSHRARKTRRVVLPGQLVILDEGPMKQFATLAEGSRRPELLQRSMIPPDVALHVECDFNTRLDRMRGSDRSHARGRSDDELRENHTFRSRWNRWLVGVVSSHTLVVDTSRNEDPVPAARAVADEIGARFKTLRSS